MAARLLAGLSAIFWAVPFFGLIDLAVPVQETPGFYESYLLETGWGVLYTFVVAAGFVLLAVRPGSVMAGAQVGLAALCLAVTAVAAGSWVQLAPALGVAFCCWAVLALAGLRERPSYRLDPVVGVVAAVLVPPAVLFAVDMVLGFREGRPPLDDDTWGIDHWPTQAAMALAVAAVAVAVAGGVRARWSGVRPSAGCVAVSAAWFGYWSATYPDHAGSVGRMWGMALVVWAVVFIVATGTRSRAPQGSGTT